MFLTKLFRWLRPKPKTLFEKLHIPSCGIAVLKNPTLNEWPELQKARLAEIFQTMPLIPKHQLKEYGWLLGNLHKNKNCKDHPNYHEAIQLLGEIVI